MTNTKGGNGKKKRAVCPYCRENDEVIPILYGFPTPEGFQKAERGEAYIGGCVIMPGQPRHFCKRDNREF